MNTDTIFLTYASAESLPAVRLMIASLRVFGGELAEVPVWVFLFGTETVRTFKDEHTLLIPLKVPDPVTALPFGSKVAACARAEQLAPAGTRSLVWIDPYCLIVQPPVLFVLGPDYQAAFRPVHIRNVGLPPSEALDAFWRGIYETVDLEDMQTSVTSFVDNQLLRTYYNSHTFSVNPALGLMQRWFSLFTQLAGDTHFQSTACADERHQTFLFQALLSTLVASSVAPARVRILPPTYNYPYHLQERIPEDRRFKGLNESVCFTYEDCSIHPEVVTGLEIDEPLRSWLSEHAPKP